jgi:hypothetical protein
MPIALLEYVLKKLKYGTAVLDVGCSRKEQDSKKVFVLMRGIYRRETKESAVIFPAIIGAVRVALVDSG